MPNLIGTLRPDGTLTGRLGNSESVLTGILSNATLRGAAVELRIEGTILQWKYEDKDEWQDLIDLSTLDYSTLQNLPTIDGVEIKGEIAQMIISAIQDILDEKVDKVEGKELSTNDFTNELKSKLDDIENNAQENVIENINVNGDSQTIDNKTVNLTIPTNLLNGSSIGSLRSVNSKTEDEDYTIGRDAVAVGFSTRAVGDRAFAEGYATKALGAVSHSEGYFTIASGDYSHGEGFQTQSTGYSSHTEGTGTSASGTDSHAEGLGTVANHRSQHVFGQYNIADTSENSANNRGDYVEIVGNGKVYTPSNARTLDWDGNEVLAGKLTVGVAPTESMDVTTKGYVDTNISNVSDAIPTNVSDLQNDANYIDASGAPVQSVNNQIGDIVITAQSIGALTQHQDISGKADKSELSSVATSGSYNDLSNKPTIPTAVSDLTDDSGHYTKPVNGIPASDLADGVIPENFSDRIAKGTGEASIITGDIENNAATGDYSYAGGGGSTRASANYAHAEGQTTYAEGIASHSEGVSTLASGTYSHAEGGEAIATGRLSHAEGEFTEANGDVSHAEGVGSITNGENSHAEGAYTITSHKSQHVFGEYNEIDPSNATADQHGNYVEIVGNGTVDNFGEETRSNARTLDWNGNEVLAGKLTIGSNPVNNMDVTTKQYVDGEIDNLQTTIINVNGTTPTITAEANTMYVCGEVTSLSFTPCASGICDVRFTSGSTVTVLTIPSTVKFPNSFDPTSLETNKIYEINILDGVYGVVTSWAI